MPAKIKNRSGVARHSRSKPPKGVHGRSFDKVYWPYIPLFLMVSFLAALGLKTGALTQGLKHPSGKVLDYSTSMQVSQLLADTNGQRQHNGEPSLALNNNLDAAAQAKANDMANRDYWSHSTPEGSPPWIFFAAAGYQYQKAGENLAAGFNDEKSVVDAWMASPGHRHNLLDPGYSDVGFGVANIANYTAAGGGAMTVVVAFYGQPVGSTDTPVAASFDSSGGAFTSSSSSLASRVSTKTSRAQIGLASLHLYNLASLSLLLVALAALALWVSRHFFVLRRVLVRGETFVFHHPMIDVGLLMMAALAFLLNQTAGLIK